MRLYALDQTGGEASAPGTRSRRPLTYANRRPTPERCSILRLNVPRSSIGPTRERMRNRIPTTKPVMTTSGGAVERGWVPVGMSFAPAAMRKSCLFASASTATGNAGLPSSTTSALIGVTQTVMSGSTKHSLVFMRFHFPFQRLCWRMLIIRTPPLFGPLTHDSTDGRVRA